MSPFESDNPYEPPRAELVSAGESFEVPETFGGKLVLAFRLFSGNLPLITAAVLTVWLPANMTIVSIHPSPAAVRESEKDSFVELLFGPLVAGAIIKLLAERSEGRRPSFGTMMGVAFRNWGRLFGARFIVGLWVLLGTLALIIPGIIMSVRYSLVDPVVILEPERSVSAWARSGELVQGKGLEILAVKILTFGALIGAFFGLNAAYEAIPLLQDYWCLVAITCIQNVLAAFLTVLLYLYYLDGRNRGKMPPTEVIDPFRLSEVNLLSRPGDRNEAWPTGRKKPERTCREPGMSM